MPTFGIRHFRGVIQDYRDDRFSLGATKKVGEISLEGVQVDSKHKDLPKGRRSMRFFTANYREQTFKLTQQSEPKYHNGLILDLRIAKESIEGAVISALPRIVPTVIRDLIVAYLDGDVLNPVDRAPGVESDRFQGVNAMVANVKSAAKAVCCWKCCCAQEE